MGNQTQLSYSRAAIEGASPIGLMIALFDTLARDLRRAAIAIHKNDIETRCKELNHAALVLARLESWVDLKAGGESAETLARFYAYVRAKMMEAGVTRSAALLETQIEMILHVRSAWQQLDTLTPNTQDMSAIVPDERAKSRYAHFSEAEPDGIRFSLSA